MEKHKITKEVESAQFNKEKVDIWFKYGLHPKYGLSQELTVLMYDIYKSTTGDNQYNGKYNCGACQDQIYRRLTDIRNYGDNLGKPLLNWEPETISPEAPVEAPVEDKVEVEQTPQVEEKKPVKSKRTTKK